ncbi:hypothetical protein [Kineosporia babensis]|uniref:Uncharacterized protein n=1 Tax=Kineosporia babensis TaxID=499548 RepID=A0A9X1SS67_9ACTN|nr:hypothetical protein [Kineosporia babensis]MCD5309971.1 hypothetical protein [Kineosporia babensis]
MNSIGRGWLFILLFGLVVILLFATRGCGANGDIAGSIEVGPSATTNPGLPYAGPAEPSLGPTQRSRTPERSETETAPDGPTDEPTRANGQPKNTVYVSGDQILPLSAGADDLDAYVGRRATARSVRVQSVVADEGFWIGTAGDRVWVQLIGPPPESPYHVERDDEVTFVGEVVAHGSGFAAEVGVNQEEGSRALTSQGAHIAVRKHDMTLTQR